MPIDNAALDALIRQRLDEILPQKLEELKAAKTPSMTIIATKGTLDWAYPPFILASTARSAKSLARKWLAVKRSFHLAYSATGTFMRCW
mgnify:CR=1 FL=1